MNESPFEPVASSPVLAPTRTAASGPCKCTRRTCWHARDCRSSGVVKIVRAPVPERATRSSVVLCRECAAPTRRNRVA